MSKELEQSLKDRIRLIAQAEGRTISDVWKSLVLERFLARLAHSPSVDALIFKGGVLLSKYLSLGRETEDLDFLLRNAEGSIQSIKDLMEATIQIPMDDGFAFTDLKVKELSQPHMDYPGYRVSAIAVLGKTRTGITIDLGVGDIIKPTSKTITMLSLKSAPLFESEISLQVYPLPYIFAEKLETVVYRDATNSRMKDYYDLWRLRGHPDTQITKIADTVKSVFKHRNTSIPESLEIDATALDRMDKDWKRFVQSLPKRFQEETPKPFSEIFPVIQAMIVSLRATS